MKHLIVYCHPNPKSFSRAMLESFVGQLESEKHEVRIRDLYEMNFDPVLKASDFVAFQEGRVPRDIAVEQDHIRWAQVITFIYPLWWTGLPVLLKGYVDRVLSEGFAYVYDEHGPRGLLPSKKILMMTPMGAPEEVYEKTGMFKSMYQTIDQGISEFCGMKVLGHRYFASVTAIDDQARKKMLEEVKKMAREIH